MRYREDPVRMLRACEFAARLDFEIEEETLGAAFAHRRDMVKASPHRLIEELLQLLASGRSAKAFDWMGRSGLLPVVLPEVDEVSGSSSGVNGFSNLGRLLDERVRAGPEVPAAVLLSSLLLPRVVVGRDRLEAGGVRLHRRRLQRLVDDVVADFGERFALSAARRSRMKKALETFQRLCEEPRSSRTVQSLVRREAFGPALELFALLSAATGSGAEALAEWRRHAAAAPSDKPADAGRPRRRRRRRRHL